jgi:hypothetical protein
MYVFYVYVVVMAFGLWEMGKAGKGLSPLDLDLDYCLPRPLLDWKHHHRIDSDSDFLDMHLVVVVV